MRKCPNCGETNINDAFRCICGYEFKFDTRKIVSKKRRPISEKTSVEKFRILGLSIPIIALFITYILWPDLIGLRPQKLTAAIMTRAFLCTFLATAFLISGLLIRKYEKIAQVNNYSFSFFICAIMCFIGSIRYFIKF